MQRLITDSNKIKDPTFCKILYIHYIYRNLSAYSISPYRNLKSARSSANNFKCILEIKCRNSKYTEQPKNEKMFIRLSA